MQTSRDSGFDQDYATGSPLHDTENDTLLNSGTYPSQQYRYPIFSRAIPKKLVVLAFISQSLVNIILSIACVTLFLWGQYSYPGNKDRDDTIFYSYGATEKYMTLDHKFDYLWSETGNSSLIRIDDLDQQRTVESISM
ncbi:hypothetical protein BGW36DRAFT_359641 [Talaromyces proteolyticus]|uniref:Uncharacterized protein n=1 Tax=Talaromyces proteolyticus TaxID=1131652 RepID=A0AAD4KQ72_9EURO|nr:uncharacterized protein BGW36DRAFT_359641 [Talaromyces proteolyticus]KAH8697867.1 hypothetical protein BGW36DRAFT_359641 [Talaromyces proteolyticus]